MFLYSGITFAIFKLSGNIPVVIICFIKKVKSAISLFLICFFLVLNIELFWQYMLVITSKLEQL